MTVLLERERAADAVRSIARGGLANLAGTGFTGAAGLGVTWLVARGLDSPTVGRFFAATAAFVLANAVAKLGTQTSLVYWLARLRALDATDLLGRCLRIGLAPVFVASTVVGAVLWFTLGPLRVLALLLPAAALSDALLAACRGLRAIRPTVVYDRILRPALQLGGLALLTVAGARPAWAYALAWAAPFVPTALLAARSLRPLLRRSCTSGPSQKPDNRTDPAPQLHDRRGFGAVRFWAFSGPRALAGLAQLALQRVDILLVAAIAGLVPAALYAVAGRFVVLGQFVNQAVSQAVQPRLAERLAVGDRAGANHLYQQATAWLVLATWPLYTLMLGYAPVYLGLFGAGYRGGTAIVVVMAAAMLMATGCGMVDMVLAMAGRTTWNLANVLLALAIMLGVDLALIPRLGALGAAIGLAAAVAANNLVPLAQIGHSLRLHPFGRATLGAAALAAGCFGVPTLTAIVLGGTHPLALTTTALGTVLYLAAVSRLRRFFYRSQR
jgi:O-antigen/teichoic acid export membrane protein